LGGWFGAGRKGGIEIKRILTIRKMGIGFRSLAAQCTLVAKRGMTNKFMRTGRKNTSY